MNKVFILPDNIINQIAAGEVVENPSAVVKELIENSIDSKAKEIKIIILKGGQELIQVTDDGYGMNLKDLETAFLRHATSKIKSQKDLDSIESLGFRGEALPSIASVSRVSMISSDGNETNKIILSGGKTSLIEKTSGKKGTKIKVKNLFFNTPARKKFLKSSNQEIELFSLPQKSLQAVVFGLPRNIAEIRTFLYLESKCQNVIFIPTALTRAWRTLGLGLALFIPNFIMEPIRI